MRPRRDWVIYPTRNRRGTGGTSLLALIGGALIFSSPVVAWLQSSGMAALVVFVGLLLLVIGLGKK